MTIIGVGLLALVGISYSAYARAHRPTQIKPYFSYSAAEIATLSHTKSLHQIKVDDLFEWDRTAFKLVSQHKIGDVDASRIYAYLLVAQRDQAALAIAAKGSYVGDIDVVSRDVICLFFPSDCSRFPEVKDAPFSHAASALVLDRIRSRIASDAVQTKPSVLKQGTEYWNGPAPQVGIDAASRKPWYLTSGSQFRAAPPPSDYRDLLAEVKQQLASITLDQREVVLYWAGGPGTKTPPGIWLDIADRYMQKHSSSLETVLQAHSDLGTAMADAVIAVFDSKYTYQKKRPFMLDSTIKTVMPTPNHPSYPAGHGTISGAAATVLSHYFASNAAEWERLGQQASTSRTWGGIHFMIDNTTGYAMGKQVAEQTLQQDHSR